MKKVIAIVLALLMAFSCSAMCFAEDAVAADAAVAEAAAEETPADETPADTGLLASIKGAFTQLVSLLGANNLLEKLQSIIDQIKAYIANLSNSNAADVAGAIDDLEAKIAELPIVGDILEYLHNLINTLKQKIKDFYAHDVETVAETDAATPVETGSTSVGIVAFATVSVAAAAAYVCTKKKD